MTSLKRPWLSLQHTPRQMLNGKRKVKMRYTENVSGVSSGTQSRVAGVREY